MNDTLKQRRQLDFIRYDKCWDSAWAKLNDLTRTLRELSILFQDWHSSHRTMDKTSDEIASQDKNTANRLKPFLKLLPTYIKERTLGPIIPEMDMIAIPGTKIRMQRFELTQFQWICVVASMSSATNVASKIPTENKKGRRTKKKQFSVDNLGLKINPSPLKDWFLNAPVTQVSHGDCEEFIKQLCKVDAKIYKLPTSKQWIHACLAGSNSKIGKRRTGLAESLAALGVLHSEYGTYAVGTKEPNLWGLFDMYGNVSEWCSDVKSSEHKTYYSLGGGYRTREKDIVKYCYDSDGFEEWRDCDRGFRLMCDLD